MDEIAIELGEGRVLRSLREDDIDPLYAVALANAEHLRPWHAWAHDVQRAATEAYVTSSRAAFERGEALPGLIADGDEIIGACGFNRIVPLNDYAEIGYWLIAARQGQGIMSAAVRALLAHGFGTLGLHRIEIGAAPNNARSRAIPERLGFTQEAVLREVERFPDGHRDIVLYALLAQDWAG